MSNGVEGEKSGVTFDEATVDSGTVVGHGFDSKSATPILLPNGFGGDVECVADVGGVAENESDRVGFSDFDWKKGLELDPEAAGAQVLSTAFEAVLIREKRQRMARVDAVLPQASKLGLVGNPKAWFKWVHVLIILNNIPCVNNRVGF